jgi:hypothetical protein
MDICRGKHGGELQEAFDLALDDSPAEKTLSIVDFGTPWFVTTRKSISLSRNTGVGGKTDRKRIRPSSKHP